MLRRRSHKKNQGSSNAKIKKLSSNSEGMMSVPQGVPPQELPAQEQPVQEHPAQEQPAQEDPAQEQPAQEQPAQEEPAQEQPAQEEPAQEQPAQEEPAQEQPAQEQPAQEQPAQEEPTEELLPLEKKLIEQGFVFGESFVGYLPLKHPGPNMTQEEFNIYRLAKAVQKAQKKNKYIYIDYTKN